jgi:hypothetical protein
MQACELWGSAVDAAFALPDPFNLILCIGTANSLTLTADRLGHIPRDSQLIRVAISMEAASPTATWAFPPTVSLTVSLFADAAPTAPTTLVEAVGPGAQPLSGATFNYDFSPAALSAGDFWAIEIKGLAAISPIPATGGGTPTNTLQMRVSIELEDVGP